MSDGISWALLIVLAALLIAAAAVDIRKREIPNTIVILIALLAIPFWWSTGLALWPDMALQVGVGLIVFFLFAVAFSLGWMGGGDVKLLGALALWLPVPAVVALLVIMSLAGGVLTLVMAVRHRLRNAGGILEIPYGVAIAFAGLWLIGQRFLNQFG
jgi:prepilin peptidase CpaA